MSSYMPKDKKMKFLLLLLLIFTTDAFSRWATKADLDYVITNEESIFIVKKDGTYKMIQTLEYELLKENAKTALSLYQVPYHSNSASVKIIEAHVKNGLQVQKVMEDKIVERSLSKDTGIDDLKVVQVPMPGLSVGSKIFIKFEMNHNKVVVPGHFSAGYKIGEGGQAYRSTALIVSEIPVFVKKNDPFNVFSVKKGYEKGKHILKIELKEPYLKKLVEERGKIDNSKFSFLQFSSDKTWEAISRNFIQRFESSLNQTISSEHERLVKRVQDIPTLEGKVDNLVTYLAENFNYIGDWRTLKGGFSPRSLDEITATKYGDCKDFSTLLTALLKKMNVDASIALVYRSSPEMMNPFDFDLPAVSHFNHAIVRISDKGKTYWVDPTNPSSYGLRHRNDIEGRRALVLKGNGFIEKIPELLPEDNQFLINKVVAFNSEMNGVASTDLKLTGIFALPFTGLELKTPQDKIQRALLMMTSQGEEAIVPEFSSHDFKTKRYSDINLNIKYSASNLSSKEDGKTYAKLPGLDHFLQFLSSNYEHWESNLFLGEPFIFERSYELKNVFAEVRPKGCNISTEWVDIKREFDLNKTGTVVKDVIKFKKAFISSSSYDSTEFQLLQSEAALCLSRNYIQFKFDQRKHAESETDVDARFAKLPLRKRIDKRYEFVRAVVDDEIESGFSDGDLIFFLKKNVKEDPKHYLSYMKWAQIIRQEGYLNGDQFNKANLSASQAVLAEGLRHNPGNQSLILEQLKNLYYLGDRERVPVELSKIQTSGPFKHLSDYVSLSRLYRMMGDKDKALQFLEEGKKVARTRSEKETIWFSLAVAYGDFNDCEKSINAYYEVLKHDPKDAFTHINMINCLVKLERNDEAVKIAKAGLEITSAGMMQRMSSYALKTRGWKYLGDDKFDLAEQDFKESIQYRPNRSAYNGLASISSKKRNFAHALSVLIEASKLDSDPGRYLFGQYHLLNGDKDQQHKLMEVAIQQTRDPYTILKCYHLMTKDLNNSDQQKIALDKLKKGIEFGEQLVNSGKLSGDALTTLSLLYKDYGIRTNENLYMAKHQQYDAMAREHQQKNNKSFITLSDGQVIEVRTMGRLPASALDLKNIRVIQVPERKGK